MEHGFDQTLQQIMDYPVSAQLHIHKSTFFYRMNKIADLLEADIYDGRRLFAYEFSFYLVDYLKRWNTPKEKLT